MGCYVSRGLIERLGLQGGPPPIRAAEAPGDGPADAPPPPGLYARMPRPFRGDTPTHGRAHRSVSPPPALRNDPSRTRPGVPLPQEDFGKRRIRGHMGHMVSCGAAPRPDRTFFLDDFVLILPCELRCPSPSPGRVSFPCGTARFLPHNAATIAHPYDTTIRQSYSILPKSI
jgi:hypothetical protein